MIGWLIFAGYMTIGATRFKTYFYRMDLWNAKEFPYLHAKEGMRTASLWSAVGLIFVWPLYEFQHWFRKVALTYLSKDEDERLRHEDKIIQQGIEILRKRGERQ